MPALHQDYYAILGVPRDADEQTIKRAFRKLAFTYHPDRNKEPEAETRFKEISEAYAVLSDPEKRAAFDAGAARGASVSAAEDLFSRVDFGDLFRGLGFDFAGAGPFEQFMRQHRQARASRGANLEVALTVSLQRVATGGEEILTLRRPRICPSCQGTGAQSGTSSQPCPECHGRGQRVQQWRQGGLIMQQLVACRRCEGQGIVYATRCGTCRGQRLIESEERLTLYIPMGVEEGMVLRVPGQGHPSPEPGGVPGDLFVLIHLAADARFERQGIDLWQEVRLPVEEAVLGTQVDIPSLQAPVRLEIPAGIQPATVLRLPHYGLPEFGSQRRGDMYVRVQIHIPAQVSSEERAVYAHLRALKAGQATQGTSPPPPTPQAGRDEARRTGGLMRWLASWWDSIDTTIRRWLHGNLP
ncbi:MAG: DnaJ C-terminal domain-containing protein [Candidatus Tectimicrobiota bacterium]